MSECSEPDVTRSRLESAFHLVGRQALELASVPTAAATSTGIARRITRELLIGCHGIRRAVVSATEPGVVAGMALLDSGVSPDPAGSWTALHDDGDHVGSGEPLIMVVGSAWELAVAEDHVMGTLGVASGLAMRGLSLCQAAPKGLRIACGGWKKLPRSMKPVLHAALDVAGLSHRLVEDDFVYIDKNVVTSIGGVEIAVHTGRALEHGPVAVQVRTLEEAHSAVTAGCSIVMVDSGSLDDLRRIHQMIQATGRRKDVQIAFGGGVGLSDLEPAHRAGADIVDVGRALLNGPLWDLRMEVQSLDAHNT